MISIEDYINSVKIYDVNPDKWDVSIDIKVQIDIVGSIIQEVVDRYQIEEIKKNQVIENDPGIW